jgi:hypothetical protein
VGYTGNAAIGVSVQLWIVVIVFISFHLHRNERACSSVCRSGRGRES